MSNANLCFIEEQGERKETIKCFDIKLNESQAAKSILDMLPIMYRVVYWGESLYMELPLPDTIETKDTSVIAVGDITYWVPGKQIHIYYGKTPLSKDNKPVPPSGVTVIGSLLGDPEELKVLLKNITRELTYITIDRADVCVAY